MRFLEEFTRIKTKSMPAELEQELLNKLAEKKNEIIESYLELVEWCETKGIALTEDDTNE